MEKAIDITLDGLHNNPEILEKANISFCAFEKILRFCTSNSYFEFNHKFYQQTSGGPMGSSLTVELAEGRIQKWEREALKNCPIPILIWKHFVDDMLTCNDSPEDSEQLYQYLNNLEPDIKLKKCFEEDGEISFLDIKFSKNNGVSVYRKPTHTDVYINYKSCHSQSVKDGIIQTLVQRAQNYCSNDSNLQKEMSHINKVLKKNGYPQKRIDYVIKRMNSPVQQSPLPKRNTPVGQPFLSFLESATKSEGHSINPI